ncbi:LytR C-terminal domain-containing protein [Streptomyces sp. 8L]|uniref:LytR C-terminal domain-containing protein n=1 Tax=Streptomyces sp. 8L TaxID=2877242 RepID=UPI0027E1200E|nr:LytR C-terminal domain-containing protein [Streptomyces sp. 8L]
MNDQQQPYGPGPYDPYYGGPRIVGYDEYGRPVYEQQGGAQQAPPQGSGDQQQGYGGYDTGRQPPVPGGPQDPQGQAPGPAQGYGYDPYGQVPHQQQPGPPAQGGPSGYDPYGQRGRVPGQSQGPDQGVSYGQGYDTGQQPPAYDTGRQQAVYGTGQQPTVYGTGQQPAAYDTGQQPAAYDTGQQGAVSDTGRQPAVDSTQQWNIPQQAPQQQAPRRRTPQQAAGQPAVPGQRSAPEEGYRTEQFSFIEEPDEDSEDVIDWLKFTESRTERREEARRRGKNRFVALLVVLAVVVVGGAGYLWYAGKLPGLDAPAKKQAAAPGGPQKRDVIVVHLHDTSDKSTSTALLVNNETTGEGSTVLLPNTLNVTNDDGTVTTLAKSVDEDGSDGTREAIGNLLGTKVAGTWRLDTPYLENLVDLVGNIEVDTDTDVPDTKKGAAPLVHRGDDQTLSGKTAVAYATYHAPGESADKQLARFGQVIQATLRKMSSDPKAATITVQTLAQILDPSLTDKDLGAALAKLADHAKSDRYKTVVLPVGEDGTLGSTGEDDVKQFLGGSVKAPDTDGVPRIGVKNATGGTSATEAARVALVNGGYTVVDTGTAARAETSSVTYADTKNKEEATEGPKTLGLTTGAVKKGSAGSSDVAVVLGGDFKPSKLGGDD